MMLAHPAMDTVFSFDGDWVNSMVVESPDFLRGFLQDIKGQIAGLSGEAVLSIDNVPVPFSAYADLIDDVVSFSINRKPLLNKLASRMERLAMDEAHYLQTAQLMAGLEKYLNGFSFDLPCGINCGKLSFSGVLRSAGVEILDDYENDLERILDYMELIRELDRDRLFFLINLRCFYSDMEMQRFVESVCTRQHRVLLIDCVAKSRLQRERRVTIDMDLCEF